MPCKLLRLALLAGYPHSLKELKKCLKQRPAHTLLKQMVRLCGFGNALCIAFGPVVEKPLINVFLDAEPYYLLKEGKIRDLP